MSFHSVANICFNPLPALRVSVSWRGAGFVFRQDGLALCLLNASRPYFKAIFTVYRLSAVTEFALSAGSLKLTNAVNVVDKSVFFSAEISNMLENKTFFISKRMSKSLVSNLGGGTLIKDHEMNLSDHNIYHCL